MITFSVIIKNGLRNGCMRIARLTWSLGGYNCIYRESNNLCRVCHINFRLTVNLADTELWEGAGILAAITTH